MSDVATNSVVEPMQPTLAEMIDSVESICDDSAAIDAHDVLRHLVKSLETLASYVRSRECAIETRLAGFVNDAMQIEQRAERRLSDLRATLASEVTQ